MIDRDDPSVHVRVWLLGAFYVEQRQDETTWIPVEPSAWGNSYARSLLKYLLAASHRRATRSAISDTLWSERDLALADKYLNNAASRLYHVFHQEGILTPFGSHGRAGYELAGQEVLWTDIDACDALLREAERLGRTSSQVLPLLEQASKHFERGGMLEGESGQWALASRAEKESVMRCCLLWLADAYEAQGMLWHVRGQYRTLLETHPLDEDILCRLLAMLHRHGMTREVRSSYEEAKHRFSEYGLSLSETTNALAEKLLHEPPSLETYLVPFTPSSTLVRNSQYTIREKERLPSEPAEASTALSSPLESTLVLPAQVMQTEKLEEVAHRDAATFFGLELAQAVTLIYQWFGMASFCHELQSRLDQEIRKLDLLKTRNSFEAFTLSRRSFLTALAALPLTLLASTQQKHKSVLALEEVLPTCAASITACWHLSGGGHLDAILPIIDSYLPTLVNVCKRASTHHEVAADLVAQIYFLKAILAWHLEGLNAAETYCTQALSYSHLTRNVNLRLTALNQHALIAYYHKDFQKALEKSEEADETLRQAAHQHIFPIVKGRVYMYLAALQAQQQLKGARQTLENARTAFFIQSTLDEFVPLYADCGDAPLLLWDGLTHYYLGQKDVQLARQALTALSVYGQLQSDVANPERFRLECLNNRTLAAIQLNDVDEALACFEAGRQGARALESKQRTAETSYAYQLMLKQWPTEKRVKQLKVKEREK